MNKNSVCVSSAYLFVTKNKELTQGYAEETQRPQRDKN
jgi:hypothetical protein